LCHMPEIHTVATTIGFYHQFSLPLMVDEERTHFLRMCIDATELENQWKVNIDYVTRTKG